MQQSSSSDRQSPIDLANVPGVQFAPPPAEHFGAIAAAIDKFAATLAPDERGGLVGIATKKGDKVTANVAIVQRIGDHSAIVGWIGKDGSWGEPLETGLAWKLRW